MRETELREILRRAVQASLALGTACGNGGVGSSVHDASGERVALGDADASGHADAAGADASFDGAAGDTGDPCHPGGFDQTTSCVTAIIPASCFDAGALGAGATRAACDSWCGGSDVSCDIEKKDGGSALVCYSAVCSNGRRPPGLTTARSRGPLLGRHFADMARAEAASVDAFDILRSELGALGAPTRLLRAAARARADEVRHARLAARLARRHGGRPTSPRVRHPKPRPLEAVARENTVEGCVRETFAAAVAMVQAATAKDARIRVVMLSIADDEVRHAALSWAIAAWADGQLSPAAHGRICRARRHAVSSLRAEIDRGVPPELAERAGVPTRAVAVRLLDALVISLWSSSAAAR
jgi:hypothetical protein